nr:putative phage abortive infection protein [Paenibacillus germinis]
MLNHENKSLDKDERFYQKKENWVIWIGILVIACAISLPFIILYKLGWNITYDQFDDLGVVGDFFGGTTVGLFTLASIIFVIAAIVMQKKELELQRKELTETREEFKTGNATAKVQQIDNAFFNMLSLHHQIVNNIIIKYSKDTYSGRQAILELKDIYEDKLGYKQFLTENPEKGFRDWYQNHRTKQEYSNKIFNYFDTIDQGILDVVYKDIHEEYGNSIGHYMRNNYRIVKFIVNNVVENVKEQQKVKEETGREPIIGDRRYYFGMLRAQWSNAEFELILINSLYSENYKFKNLILRYDVLDILDTKGTQDELLDCFKLKYSMTRLKPYRKLIEIIKI